MRLPRRGPWLENLGADLPWNAKFLLAALFLCAAVQESNLLELPLLSLQAHRRSTIWVGSAFIASAVLLVPLAVLPVLAAKRY